MNAQSPLPSTVWRLVSKRSSPLVAVRPTGGTPFYFIHPVAGDITCYDRLFELIDPQQSLYGIQVPKERMKAAMVRSLASLTEDYAKAIDEQTPQGPLMVGGYSAGAILALDVAQRLQRAGREIKLLVAIDGAPLNTGAELSAWHPAYLAKMACNVPRWLCSRRRQDFTLDGIRTRVTDRMVFRASAFSARARGAPARQHVTTVAGLVGRAGWHPDHVAFIRALYDALHAYVPVTYGGRVILFEARINRLFALTQADRIWRALAPRCECIQLSAHHGSLLSGDAITGAVAKKLNEVFAELHVLESS